MSENARCIECKNGVIELFEMKCSVCYDSKVVMNVGEILRILTILFAFPQIIFLKASFGVIANTLGNGVVAITLISGVITITQNSLSHCNLYKYVLYFAILIYIFLKYFFLFTYHESHTVNSIKMCRVH